MAAAYLFHLAKDHPFVDGNKRAAAASALVFLEINGLAVAVRNDRLHAAVVAVADGRLTKTGVAEFLRRHVRPT
jgi:death-on-curing protein